jgi:hypothetical protein
MATITKKNEATIEQPTKAREKKSRNVELSLHRSTGPRTKRGKRKTRHNALKHGIFSAAVLKGRESKSEYNSFLMGLVTHFDPEGAFEGLLVDKLASLLWRHRRLLQVECAEIAKVSEFIEDDMVREQLIEREKAEDSATLGHGMLRGSSNPFVFERAIEMLKELRESLEERGLNLEEDEKVLGKLYGEGVPGEFPKGLFFSYALFSGLAELHANGEKDGLPAEEAAKKAICYVGKEIKRLEWLKNFFAKRMAGQRRYSAEASLIPSHHVLDRLLRYEASLDRMFDRTLTQLERLQRQRRGDKDLPPIKVDVAA